MHLHRVCVPVGGRSEVRKTRIYRVFTCMMALILGAWRFFFFFCPFQKLYFLVGFFFVSFSTTGSDKWNSGGKGSHERAWEGLIVDVLRDRFHLNLLVLVWLKGH